MPVKQDEYVSKYANRYTKNGRGDIINKYKKAIKLLVIHYNINDTGRARRKLCKYLKAKRRENV